MTVARKRGLDKDEEWPSPLAAVDTHTVLQEEQDLHTNRDLAIADFDPHCSRCQQPW
jgi:hypothetical protein